MDTGALAGETADPSQTGQVSGPANAPGPSEGSGKESGRSGPGAASPRLLRLLFALPLSSLLSLTDPSTLVPFSSLRVLPPTLSCPPCPSLSSALPRVSTEPTANEVYQTDPHLPPSLRCQDKIQGLLGC
eukprot:156250-Rhodomonas_salina.2